MIYIKLGDDMTLNITVNEPIRRGDNLSNKLTFLVPLQLREIDMIGAVVYLCYLRADGSPDIVRLERSEQKYNELYYQYTVPVSCKLTRYPGQVCTWLEVFSGSVSNPTIAKSSECLLFIEDAKNIGDYLCGDQITVLYQMQKEIDSNKESIDSELVSKVDGLAYDKGSRKLSLTSNGVSISEPVVVPSDEYMEVAKDAAEDTWSDMTDTSDTSDGSSGSETWEQM